MAYFCVISLKVLLLVLGTTKGIDEPEDRLRNDDYSIVAKVLQKLFNMYSASLRETRSFSGAEKPSTKHKDTIDKVIKLKINELKPYLEDNSSTFERINFEDINTNDNDNNVTLEGDEETTIIEFVPQADYAKESLRIWGKQPEFKDNVKKYKKIRDLIKNTLIEESVSVKSQKLVLNTLDSMLAYMVRSQCPANTDKDSVYRERLLANDQISQNYDLTKNWTRKWNQVREKYTKIWRQQFPQQDNPARKLFMFFEQIQDFLTSIMNDSVHISNNYKVVCKLVKMNEQEVINFNEDNLIHFKSDSRKLSQKCPAFKVCSEELELFMGHLYRKLNSTIAHTFQNYAAMYSSDVNSDGSSEKAIVVAAINNISDRVKHKAKKIFKVETSAFELDHEKNADNNIKLLKTYVHDVIENSLTATKNYLHDTVLNEELTKKLILNLKQDLKSGLDVDLGNLRTELKNEICRDFSSCNGLLIRRSNVDGQLRSRRHLGAIDKNKVYVKLQLSLDKGLKEKIAKGDINLDNLLRNYEVTTTSPVINVTRTTLKNIMRTHATRTTHKPKKTKQTSKKVHKKQSKMYTRLYLEDILSELRTEIKK